MGRPRKNLEQEIENEAGLSGIAVLEEPKAMKPKAANEFENEYTLKVDADYDPTADLFRIPKKDPNFEYRYLRDDSERISITTSTLLYQKGGWQLAPKAHSLRIGFSESDLSDDGFRRIGKHILAFMPKSLFEKKVAAKTAKTNARTGEIKRLVEQGITTIGGQDMHKTMRGIRSQKDSSYVTPED